MNQTIKNRINQIKRGQVPEGYEKTSFGIFPATWEKSKKLKELGVFGKGKGIPGNEMKDSGLPCVGYGDLYMRYHVYFNKAKCFVNPTTAKNSKPITKGTLLFTGTGETALEIGKCVCYYGDETIYAGGDILLFNSSKVNPLFLAHQQNIDFAIRQKARYGQGHSVVHIQRNNLEKLHVAYPKSPVEQQQIANVLMVWDKAIEAQNQYITTLEKKKKALMQKLLQPKPHWQLKLLGQYLVERNEYSIINNQYELLTSAKSGIYLQSNYFKKQVASANNIGYAIMVKGDYTYRSMSDTGDYTFNKLSLIENGIVSPAYTVFFTKYCCDEYIGFLLNSYYIKKEIKKIIQGGTRTALKFSEVKKFRVLMPEIQEQKEIASILAMADAEISMEKAKLELYKLQKKSLMQLLLTGIVRTIDNG